MRPINVDIPPGRQAGQPPTAPPGGGFAPTRGRGLPSALCATLLTLTACAPMHSPDISVRHFGSTQFYEEARFHLFTFDPREPRSLGDRIRLAQAEIARDPDCRWGNAPRAVIEEATLAQGAQFADTLLAAPVICET